MTPETATETFLRILNFAVAADGFRFDSQTPLRMIIRQGVTHPETFLGCVADALGIDETEIDQMLIEPEADTVAQMFEKMVGSRASQGVQNKL